MSASSGRRLVPIWMFIVCWLVGLPLLLDSDFPWFLQVMFFVPLLGLTIGLFRRRVAS